ncbi:2-isopropylmalate synthase [Candidatus Bathyarchaeota archaeon]|nr:2-isopropylmalate synthase [Candidatus Bathyarchaeota archaeon]
MRKTIFRKLEARGLIVNYNRFRKNLPRKLPKEVFFWDETLNEGEQTPTVVLTYVEKVKLARILDKIGIDVINVGFPGLSEEEEKNVRRISNESFEHARIASSARILKSDIDACLGCGIREISIFTPFNGLNLRFMLKMGKEEVLQKTAESIEYAKKHGLSVNFVLEDASRTPLEEILQILEEATKAGADRLVIADTVGFLRPLSIRYVLSRVRRGLSKLIGKEVPFSVRCHNDFGLATANTLAAMEEGVNYPHVCIAGFGERAGLAPLEEVVMALEILYGVDTNINAKKLYRLGQQAEKSFASPMPFHKPIVGENAFSHASEKHIHGMLAHRLIYEPFPPKMIGRETTFYLGRQIGRKLVERRLELAKIKATPVQMDEIIRRLRRQRESLDKGERLMTFYQLKRLMREMQKGLTEEDFWRIVKQVTGQKPKLMPRIKKEVK